MTSKDLKEKFNVDIKDILEIARSIVNLTNLTTEQKAAGDLNKDGKNNINDIVAIARIIVGIV